MRRSDSMVLQAVAGARASVHGWVRGNCPWCEGKTGKADRKKCLGLHLESSKWHCFKCGSGGYIVGLSTESRDLVSATPEAKKVAQAMEPPEGFWLLFEGDGLHAQSLDAPRRYLTDPKSEKGRGLSEDVLRAARVGACVKGDYAGRVVVPVFGDAVDESGDPVWLGWSSRPWVDDYEGMGYRYPQGMMLSQIVYNHSILHVKTDEPALAVEGVFDTHWLWPDGCATLGSTREEHLEAFRAASRPVVLVPDGDAWFAGMLAAKRLRFDGVRAGMLRLPPRTDPDEFPPDVIREAARTAVSSERDYISL